MLVKYVMKTTATYADLVSDIRGIVNGSITTTGSLSASANTSATTFIGTYPAGYYAEANATAYAFSKIHSANNSNISYFKLGFDGVNGIANVTLAQGYVSATDTVSNSYSITYNATIGLNSLGVDPATTPIDIIVNKDNLLIIQHALASGFVSISDVGYNGTSKTFTSQMITTMIVSNTTIAPYVVTPINYRYTNNSIDPGQTVGAYGTTNTGVLTCIAPFNPPYSSTGNVAIMENPVFTYNSDGGNLWSVVYGWNALQQGRFGDKAVYYDTDNVYRYVTIHDDANAFSIAIS